MSTLQSAVVTGAGSGIGRAVATALFHQGVGVVASDVDAAAVDALVAATTESAGTKSAFVVAHHGDVMDSSAMEALVDQAVERFGALDIAINCAGGGDRGGLLAELNADDFDHMIGINLKGVFLSMRYQLRHMAARGRGAVVNISSTAGLRGVPGGSLYSAAKHGVIGLTKSAALDYASRNIRINAICPGAIATPQFERVIAKRFPDRPLADAVLSVGKACPLGRVGTPEEVAQLALWLVSDAARYVTGQAYVIDGGKTIL